MSEVNKHRYNANMLIKIAKRHNNKKRSYLLVNPLQGKHLPVSPIESLQLMETLGNQIKSRYSNNKILLIAFAETGTAIGGAIAECIGDNCIFMHTTREEVTYNSNYIFFSEEHSHATEQRLCIDNFAEYLSLCDTIIFIDDEITTGKTIINGINNIRKIYPKLSNMQIIVGSLLNSMNAENLKRFEQYNIKSEYLVKLDIDNDYEQLASEIETSDNILSFFNTEKQSYDLTKYILKGRPEPRKGIFIRDYIKTCEDLYKDIAKLCIIKPNYKSVLIMGTEEFMYPALFIGRCLEKDYASINIVSHSTTRSPIATSNAEKYPITERNIINSFYDSSRETYVYNLEYYEKAIIITDSLSADIDKGINSLANAINEKGCRDITVIEWR